MKKLLASTAIALLAAAPLAATAQDAATGIYLPSVDSALRVSTLMGKNIYVSEADVAMDPVAEASADWTSIGEVNDIVLGNNGDVQAVLVDVGGFLGMGEKTVAVNLDEIRVVPDSASPDNFFLVFKGSKAEMEGAPAFALTGMNADGTAMDTTATTATSTDGTMATDTAATGAAAGSATTDTTATDTAATDTATNGTAAEATAADGMATTADAAPADTMVAPEGMQMADMGTISVDKLIGADVRGADNSDVGEVGDLVMDGDKLSAVVVDVGGFLGIGEKPVALSLDQVKVWQDQSGTLIVAVNDTKDALKAMPTYQKP